LGKEIEEEIHEKFRKYRDTCKFNENRYYLEESYDRFAYLYNKKGITSGIVLKVEDKDREKAIL
jgi:hypothetical protein